jgi:hypothetical protein
MVANVLASNSQQTSVLGGQAWQEAAIKGATNVCWYAWTSPARPVPPSTLLD